MSWDKNNLIGVDYDGDQGWSRLARSMFIRDMGWKLPLCIQSFPGLGMTAIIASNNCLVNGHLSSSEMNIFVRMGVS